MTTRAMTDQPLGPNIGPNNLHGLQWTTVAYSGQATGISFLKIKIFWMMRNTLNGTYGSGDGTSLEVPQPMSNDWLRRSSLRLLAPGCATGSDHRPHSLRITGLSGADWLASRSW